MKEPQLEIVGHNSPKNSSYENLLDIFGKRNFFDSRIWRFGIILLVVIGIKIALPIKYMLASSAYGETVVDNLIKRSRDRFPKRLFLIFTLKGALHTFLLFLLLRLLLAIAIGWLAMPLNLLASLYKKIVKTS